jgi:hypothetical protein
MADENKGPKAPTPPPPPAEGPLEHKGNPPLKKRK